MGKGWTPQRGLPDLTGKVVVVTGASTGIGLHTARNLALKGATVYITARSATTGLKGRQAMLTQSPELPESRLIFLPLDLSSIGSILKFVEELKAKEQKVDILVLNAGVATKDLETTDAGWEMDMAVAHVGHFILTNSLLPLLKNAASSKSSDVRVVSLSSNAHTLFLPSNYEFDFSTPAFLTGKLPYEPWKYRVLQKRMMKINALLYSMAKLATVIFAQELQHHFDELGLPIISVSVNPGPVKSDNAVDIFTDILQPVMSRLMLDPDPGSFASIFAAAAPEVSQNPKKFKGKYLEPIGEVRTPHVVVKDQAQCRAFWDTTTREVSKYLAEKGLTPLNAW